MERNQFTFYRSYYEAVKELPKKEQSAVMIAICAYALDEEEPNLTGTAKAIFDSLVPRMDTERRDAKEGRRSGEYKAWRANVFSRDNYTCQKCGAHGVKINAHHKKQYAFYPELRYELSNGITLCVPCHKAVHRGC